MKVYISGAMTGMPEYNYPAFFAAEEMLKEQGYDVVNPARSGVREGWCWGDYVREDLKWLVECDKIAMIPGWENSKGARLERHIAQNLEMPIILL